MRKKIEVFVYSQKGNYTNSMKIIATPPLRKFSIKYPDGHSKIGDGPRFSESMGADSIDMNALLQVQNKEAIYDENYPLLLLLNHWCARRILRTSRARHAIPVRLTRQYRAARHVVIAL